jgi:uncharacterized membrane protein YjfL (UPF0719 family)
MMNKLIFRFTLAYFFSVTCLTLISYLLWPTVEFEVVLMISFVIAFFYLLHRVDKKINNNYDLIKGNYWQLKNELKRKVNGKSEKSTRK